MTLQSTTKSTTAVRAVCAFVFCLFSFAYLYVYQADILSYIGFQFTHEYYNDLVEALVITGLLQFLQYKIAKLFPFGIRAHALTYVPSMLILFLLTEVWLWGGWLFPLAVAVVVMGLWLGGYYLQRDFIPVKERSVFFLLSRSMWVNLLILTLMMIVVATAGTDNAVLHYRLKAEAALLRGDTEGALEAGKKSLETDASLTMLRAYALAKEGRLGDALFTYAVAGTGKDLLPSASVAGKNLWPSADARLLMFPQQEISRFVKTHRRAAADYRLCGCLMDGRLDDFVRMLPTVYAEHDSLPLHYREALTLYTHLRSQPRIVYHHAVMDEDYNNMKQLERNCHSATERHLKVMEQYGNTYWYYYNYVWRSRKSE